MSRIKVVPNATPNADGHWIECPFPIAPGMRWRHMEAMVLQLVPEGHHVVSVEANGGLTVKG
jgi:hypothetical protein